LARFFSAAEPAATPRWLPPFFAGVFTAFFEALVPAFLLTEETLAAVFLEALVAVSPFSLRIA
jgi:hypothetical protein